MDYQHHNSVNFPQHQQHQQHQQSSMYPLQPVQHNPHPHHSHSHPHSQQNDDSDSDGDEGDASQNNISPHGPQMNGGNGDASEGGGGGGSSKKQAPKAQASFLTKLYDLLEQPEYQSMIRWDANGEHIIVERPEMLALHVLPSVYRQSRFASFTRQLNIYGFFRKANLRNLNPGIEDPDASTWSHPTLRRSSRGTEAVTGFKRRVQDRKPKGRKKSQTGQSSPMSSHGHMGGMGQGPNPGYGPRSMMPPQQGMGGGPGMQQNRNRAYTQPSLHVNTRPMSGHGGPMSAGAPQFQQGGQWSGQHTPASSGYSGMSHAGYNNAPYSASSHATSPTDDSSVPGSAASQAHPHTFGYAQNTSSVFLPAAYPGSVNQGYPQGGAPDPNQVAQQQQGWQGQPQQSSIAGLLNPQGYSRPGTAAGPPSATAPYGSSAQSPYATSAISPTASRPTTAYSAASSMPSMTYEVGEPPSSAGTAATGQYDYRPRSSAGAPPPSHLQQQQQQQQARPNTGQGVPNRPRQSSNAGASNYSPYPLRPMTAPDMQAKHLMQLATAVVSPTTGPGEQPFAYSAVPAGPTPTQETRPGTGHSSMGHSSASGASGTEHAGSAMDVGSGVEAS